MYKLSTHVLFTGKNSFKERSRKYRKHCFADVNNRRQGTASAELIVFDEMPESAVLYTEMLVLSDRTKDHDVEFVDDYWTWILFSHTSIETTYEFSDTVILRNTFDLHKRLFYLNPVR